MALIIYPEIQLSLMKKIFLLLLLILQLGLDAQNITTFAGTGSSVFSGDGGQASAAGIPDPAGGAFDRFGNLYMCDYLGVYRIRKISPSGVITTVAGIGAGGFNGDSIPATTAKMDPQNLKIDSLGNLIFVDNQTNRVRKIDASTGLIFTIAGNGTAGFGGDGGPATAAMDLSRNKLYIC